MNTREKSPESSPGNDAVRPSLPSWRGGIGLVVLAIGFVSLLAFGLEVAAFVVGMGRGVTPLLLIAGLVGSVIGVLSSEKWRHDNASRGGFRAEAVIFGLTSALVALAVGLPTALGPGDLGRVQTALVTAGLVGAIGSFVVAGATPRARAALQAVLVSLRRLIHSRPIPGGTNRVDEVAGGSSWWRRNTYDLLAVITLLILASATLLYFLREPLLSDDSTYFDTARGWLSGNVRADSANVHRLGLIFSSSLAQLLVGYTPAAYYGVSFAFNAGLIVALYAFARVWFPVAVAFIGSVFLLWTPIFLEEGTVLLPDWPALFWFVLGALLVVRSVRTSETGVRPRLLMALAAGGCLFMSLWIKEAMAPLFLGLIPVLFVVELHPAWRRALAVSVVSLAALFVGELMINWAALGNPLSRLRAILGGHVSGATGWVDRGLVPGDLTWGDLAFRYLDGYLNSTHGLLFAVAVGLSLVVAIVSRSRGLLVFGSFALIGWLFVSLAVVSIDPLIPLLRTKERYLSMSLVFIPPFIAGSAWVALDQFGRSSDNGPQSTFMLGSSALISVLLLGSVVTGLVDEADNPRYVKNGAAMLSEARRAAVALDGNSQIQLERIISEWRTLRGIRLYLPPALRSHTVQMDHESGPSGLAMQDVDDFVPGDFVVLNYTRLLFNESRYYSEPLPDFIHHPPPHWIQIGSSRLPRASMFYVVDAADIEMAAMDLGLLIHAYPHREGDVASLVADPVAEGVRFTVVDAADVRIVLGKDRYHRVPEEDELTLSDEPRILVIDATVDPAGDVSVSSANIWLFPSDGSDPVPVSLRRASGGESEIRYTGALSVGPLQGYQAFRVVLRVEGDGDVTVRMTVTPLPVDLGIAVP